MTPIRTFKDLTFCFLSAFLLALAFPKTGLWPLAWFALIPFLATLDGQSYGRSFRRGLTFGLFYFTLTFYWLFHLTAWFSLIVVVGVLLLLLYLALYFGLFAVGYRYFAGRVTLVRVIVLSCLWVVLEFIRGHLFSGFGWASLGHSQFEVLPIIQIADLTGVYGVSFLVIFCNLALKELLFTSSPKKERLLPVLILAGLIGMTLAYGWMRLGHSDGTVKKTVAIIQGNIPQELKWDDEAWSMIMDRYQGLTRQAVRERPHLVIWPETAFPGFLWEDENMYDELVSFVREMGVPLLFGAVLKEGDDYYNATLLLSKEGEVLNIYRKAHLVPFGEYLPLRNVLPFLSDIVPIDDFSSGQEHTVFRFPSAKEPQATFSVLTCFEDTVPHLSRRSVLNGAGLLVNLTNDAWFKDSIAPFLHLQSSVFRTVENRRALVRSANTGISGMIDSDGRLTQAVRGSNGEMTYVSGYVLNDVAFHTDKTFYTRWGDVFVLGCLFCLLGAMAGARRCG